MSEKEIEKTAVAAPQSGDVKSLQKDPPKDVDGNEIVVVEKRPNTSEILGSDRADVGEQDIVVAKKSEKEFKDKVASIEESQLGDELDSLVQSVAKNDGVIAFGHVPADDRGTVHRASIDDPLRDLNNNIVDINNDILDGFHQIDGDKVLHSRGQLTSQDAQELANVLSSKKKADSEKKKAEAPAPVKKEPAKEVVKDLKNLKDHVSLPVFGSGTAKRS